MKYLILIVGILLWATDINNAQVNRYNVASPAKDNSFNTYVGYDLESLYRLYQDASVLTPQIAGHNLKNKLGLIKFGNYDNNKKKIYT